MPTNQLSVLQLCKISRLPTNIKCTLRHSVCIAVVLPLSRKGSTRADADVKAFREFDVWPDYDVRPKQEGANDL